MIRSFGRALCCQIPLVVLVGVYCHYAPNKGMACLAGWISGLVAGNLYWLWTIFAEENK